MGVTHTSIVSGLFPSKHNIKIVEPNYKIRTISKRTLGYEFHKNLDKIYFDCSKVIITTPPESHAQLVQEVIARGASSVFVEKPFGVLNKRVQNHDAITVGYVLRFSEVIQELKKIVDEDGCRKIRIDYSSNTLTKPPKGWRNGPNGGVLNEMGSHLIDLLLYLVGEGQFVITHSECQSVISDVDDIVFVKGLIGRTEIELSLNWVNKGYRKPVWSGQLITNEGVVNFDQQSIDSGFEAANVGYYVRGRDFSLQMKHFICQDKSICCNAPDANRVHQIIASVKENQ